MASPHYQNGRFQCLEPIDDIMEPSEDGESRLSATWKFLFGDKTGLVPSQPILSKKMELTALPLEEDVIIWMGHSTFYLQLAGHRILIDPVFSAYASPLFSSTRHFLAATSAPTDVLLLTHDH